MEIDEHLKYTLYVSTSFILSCRRLTKAQLAIRPLPQSRRADGLKA